MKCVAYEKPSSPRRRGSKWQTHKLRNFLQKTKRLYSLDKFLDNINTDIFRLGSPPTRGRRPFSDRFRGDSPYDGLHGGWIEVKENLASPFRPHPTLISNPYTESISFVLHPIILT